MLWTDLLTKSLSAPQKLVRHFTQPSVPRFCFNLSGKEVYKYKSPEVLARRALLRKFVNVEHISIIANKLNASQAQFNDNLKELLRHFPRLQTLSIRVSNWEKDALVPSPPPYLPLPLDIPGDIDDRYEWTIPRLDLLKKIMEHRLEPISYYITVKGEMAFQGPFAHYTWTRREGQPFLRDDPEQYLEELATVLRTEVGTVEMADDAKRAHAQKRICYFCRTIFRTRRILFGHMNLAPPSYGPCARKCCLFRHLESWQCEGWNCCRHFDPEKNRCKGIL